FEEWRTAHPEQPYMEAWDWPRHLVIVPNYKEDEENLARTLASLAAQGNASQLVVVLAMEAREVRAADKAQRLIDRFAPSFGLLVATFHPEGLPGDTPGKGSNEAWA